MIDENTSIEDIHEIIAILEEDNKKLENKDKYSNYTNEELFEIYKNLKKDCNYLDELQEITYELYRARKRVSELVNVEGAIVSRHIENRISEMSEYKDDRNSKGE